MYAEFSHNDQLGHTAARDYEVGFGGDREYGVSEVNALDYSAQIDTSAVGAETAKTAPAEQTVVVCAERSQGKQIDLYTDVSCEISPNDRYRALDMSIRKRTHPYHPAEDVTSQDLAAYYRAALVSFPTRPAWCSTEQALQYGDPAILEKANQLTEQICLRSAPVVTADSGPYNRPQYATVAQGNMYHDAATLRASLPAFADRIRYGAVRQGTACAFYNTLAGYILPSTVDNGGATETIVQALAARAVANGADASNFLYLSSPRESRNTLHNHGGQVYNHDFHQIGGGIKTMIEVKLGSRSQKRPDFYAPDITVVRALESLGPAILGIDMNSLDVLQRHALIPVFLQTARDLMRDEVTTGVYHASLDAAADALFVAVQAQRPGQIDPRLYSRRLHVRQLTSL